VLEHFTKDEALMILKKAIDSFEYVVVNVPLGLFIQGASGGNIYEEHKATFQIEDFDVFKEFMIKKIVAQDPQVDWHRLGHLVFKNPNKESTYTTK
jgi:hypothetical protein